jgi:TIR domain-containing protein
LDGAVAPVVDVDDKGVSDAEREYDVFISYASEDREAIAAPLAHELRERGWRVWFDEFELSVGDSLRASIDMGLSRSRFGIVIMSPEFFGKNWPQKELAGLFARETTGGKMILPIRHRITQDEVLRASPMLADKIALDAEALTVADMVDRLERVVG